MNKNKLTSNINITAEKSDFILDTHRGTNKIYFKDPEGRNREYDVPKSIGNLPVNYTAIVLLLNKVYDLEKEVEKLKSKGTDQE